MKNHSSFLLLPPLNRRIKFSILWISAVMVVMIFFLPTLSESGQTTLFEKETPYQYLRVVEDTQKGAIYLCNRDCDFIQGGIMISRPDALMLDYMRSVMVGLAYIADPPRNMLFIGMGIGAMPRYLAGRYPDVRMDIVEIDPDIPPVAKRFFHFVETPNMHIHINDGALFVKNNREVYDVIFLDACLGPDIPEQLASIEFFQLILWVIDYICRCLEERIAQIPSISMPEIRKNIPHVFSVGIA